MESDVQRLIQEGDFTNPASVEPPTRCENVWIINDQQALMVAWGKNLNSVCHWSEVMLHTEQPFSIWVIQQFGAIEATFTFKSYGKTVSLKKEIEDGNAVSELIVPEGMQGKITEGLYLLTSWRWRAFIK